MTKYTPRAQKVLQITSAQEARRLANEMLYPEHIFLAILREPDGAAVYSLYHLGLDFEDIHREVEMLLRNKKVDTMVFGDLPYSERFSRILEQSVEESSAMSQEYVGTEHLLLAIVHEDDPDALIPEMLKNRDIDYAQVRDIIIRAANIKEVQFMPPKMKKNKRKSQYLERFTIDITQEAVKGKLDPVIGREKEINRIVQVLSRRHKNNPILIGDPGVGKTAIVEGLAQLIVTDNISDKLVDKRIMMLDIGLLVAGTKYRGEFEERLKNIIKEIEEDDDLIVFIDEIHTILGAGNAEGALDASNMLKPALARGLIHCIGATTVEEYRKRFEKDKALVRRFQPILIEEPSAEDTVGILNQIKFKYEEFHHVSYTDEAIRAAVFLSQRFIQDRQLPDKAIDLIDETGAFQGSTLNGKPEYLIRLGNEIKFQEQHKEKIVQDQNYEEAAVFRDKILKMRQKYETKKSFWLKSLQMDKIEVGRSDIENVLSHISGVPVNQLNDRDNLKRYLNMENFLTDSVKGQNEAVSAISKSIRKNIAGMRNTAKPIASLFFLGPTGTGKSALAKELAKFLFGKEEDLIRVDMSEYSEKFNVSKMVGAPPGYVGHETGGGLTEKVRRHPYSVVLFDEIEKAHPDVYHTFLQIMDEGVLTDNNHNQINFKNTVLIFTSNVGSERFSKKGALGFNDAENDKIQKKDSVLEELNREFRPEFINRLDEIIVFNELDQEVLMDILNVMIRDMNERLSEQGISIKLNKKLKEMILADHYQEKYGARSLLRALSQVVEVPVSEMILKEGIATSSGDEYEIRGTLKQGEPKYRIKKSEKRQEDKTSAHSVGKTGRQKKSLPGEKTVSETAE